jgi:hypothetical protein
MPKPAPLLIGTSLLLAACTPPEEPLTLGAGTWAPTTTAPAPTAPTTLARKAPNAPAAPTAGPSSPCAQAIRAVLARLSPPPATAIVCPADPEETFLRGRSHWGLANLDTGTVYIRRDVTTGPSGRLRYVLAHELCHILNAQTGTAEGLSEPMADACASEAGFPRG